MDNCIWCRTKARLSKLAELSVIGAFIAIAAFFIAVANLVLFIGIQTVFEPTGYPLDGFFGGMVIFFSGAAIVADYFLLDMLHGRIHKNR